MASGRQETAPAPTVVPTATGQVALADSILAHSAARAAAALPVDVDIECLRTAARVPNRLLDTDITDKGRGVVPWLRSDRDGLQEAMRGWLDLERGHRVRVVARATVR